MSDVLTKKKNEVINAGLGIPGTSNYYTRNNVNPATAAEASAALNNLKAPGQYQASASVQNAYNQLQNTLANKPGQYQSNYAGTMQQLVNDIVNQKPFKYDFNADTLYQNYKNAYMQQGKQAMLDTQAAASALSGGYGNSYGASAGAQAYQQNLGQLNNMIPQLYQMALQKYQMDSQVLKDKFNVVGNQEDREYGQHRDNVNDWKDERNYGLDQYNTLYNQDYGAYRDQVGDYYNDRNYLVGQQNNLWNQEQTDKEFDYRKDRDNVSDSQWQQTFDYNQGRDNISDSHWQQSFDYQKERDKVSDSQWQQQMALNKMKAAQSGTSKKTDYNDGKAITSDIKKQIEYLDGDDLDEYLGRLVDSGYSYEAIEDYLIQANKQVGNKNNDAFYENLNRLYRDYVNKKAGGRVLR